MKHYFFGGLPHHKVHMEFVQSIVGGEYIPYACGIEEKEFPDEILDRDGTDVIWFFNDLYFNLHPLLKGRQVYLGHGMSFKNFMNPRRAEFLNRYIDCLWVTGMPDERFVLQEGVDPKKIRRIGLPVLLDIPRVKPEPNSLLFSSTYFTRWNQDKTLLGILERLPPSLKAFVTCHPQTPPQTMKRYREICEGRPNMEYFVSHDDLIKSVARCEAALCNIGTVSTMVWYLRKPVILTRGWVGKNPLKGLGWRRVKRWSPDPLFHRILDQSPKLTHWRQFDATFLKSVRWVPDTEQMFYPWNHDRDEMVRRVKDAVAEVEG